MFGYILAVIIGLVILFGIYKLVRHSTDKPHPVPPPDNYTGGSGGRKEPDNPEKF